MVDTHGAAATGCSTDPTEMSGGQQQRVAVARALATRPQIIFADEPTGNLDSKAGAEVLAFMRSAVDDMGQTIVMVTHDPHRRQLRRPDRLPGRRPASSTRWSTPPRNGCSSA